MQEALCLINYVFENLWMSRGMQNTSKTMSSSNFPKRKGGIQNSTSYKLIQRKLTIALAIFDM